jgi:hypothetical protein
LDNIPDNFIVNGEVGMGKDVSQSGNFAPFDLGMAIAQVVRNIFDGFADDLQIMGNGIEGTFICNKSLWCQVGGVALDFTDAGEDVVKVEGEITRHRSRSVSK